MKFFGTLTLLLAAFLTISGVETADGGQIYEPARGSALRKQILDSIRPRAQHELGGDVEFVVREIRVMDNFCFVQVNPQRPGGREIRVSETIYAHEDLLDGLGTTVLLKFVGGRWSICEWSVGSNDAPWEDWHDKWKLPWAFLGFSR